MTPGVGGNLMTTHIFSLENSRVGDASRADDEESSLEGVGVEEVQKLSGVRGRAVVVRQTPSILVGAGGDIGRP